MWRSTITSSPGGAGRAGRAACPMPGSPAWAPPRCCSASPANAAGSGSPVPGWAPVSLPAAPPGYHKRLKAAAPLLAVVIDHLARQALSWHDQVRLIDAAPLPCGTSRETAKRSDLAGWAGYGYCPSHSRWYWGCKLHVIAAPAGMPVAWCLASPKDRATRGSRRPPRPRPPQSRAAPRPGPDRRQRLRWARVRATGHRQLPAAPRRPDRRDEVPRHGSIGWIRQSRSSTPSRDSCPWKTTAPAPVSASTPAPPSACWPWPPPSGTTGPSAHPTSAP
jgi:hypothetical protein